MQEIIFSIICGLIKSLPNCEASVLSEITIHVALLFNVFEKHTLNVISVLIIRIVALNNNQWVGWFYITVYDMYFVLACQCIVFAS